MKRSGTEAEKNVSNKISAGAQRDQGVLEQFLQDSPQTEDARAPLSMELVPDSGEKNEEDEPMDESNEPFEDFEKISYAYIPGKGNSVLMFQKINREIAGKRHPNALKICKTIIHHSIGG